MLWLSQTIDSYRLRYRYMRNRFTFCAWIETLRVLKISITSSYQPRMYASSTKLSVATPNDRWTDRTKKPKESENARISSGSTAQFFNRRFCNCKKSVLNTRSIYVGDCPWIARTTNYQTPPSSKEAKYRANSPRYWPAVLFLCSHILATILIGTIYDKNRMHRINCWRMMVSFHIVYIPRLIVVCCLLWTVRLCHWYVWWRCGNVGRRGSRRSRRKSWSWIVSMIRAIGCVGIWWRGNSSRFQPVWFCIRLVHVLELGTNDFDQFCELGQCQILKQKRSHLIHILKPDLISMSGLSICLNSDLQVNPARLFLSIANEALINFTALTGYGP